MKKISQKHYIEPDILLVSKPKGITSFDVIRKLRNILGIRKIGHAGTLDPLAHGLMIVGIASGTKKMTSYLKLPKTYIAHIRIGVSTTTGDLEGEVVDEKVPHRNDMKEKDLEDVALSLVGPHTLQVPLYSAIKVQGKPLYEYARNNITPPYIPEKEMNINDIQYLDSYRSGNYYVLSLRMSVSSGTYIRTIGELVGSKLGYPATLQGLYRVSIGKYLDKNAYKLKKKKFSHSSPLRAIIEWLFGKRS